MCVGVMMILYFLGIVLVATLGTDTLATVTKSYTRTGSKGGTTYCIDYKFSAHGRDYSHSDAVSPTTYAAVTRPVEAEGQAAQVRIRYLAIGDFHLQLLIEDHSPWKEAGTVLFIALFWNGILSIFVTLAWVIPIRQRLLVKHGEVARGTILKSRTSQGKSTRHYVTFRFTDPANGSAIEREIQLPREWPSSAVEPGREVTVLYSPAKPRRALIYELSGYRVEGAQPI